VQRLDELDLRLRSAWENRLSRLVHRLQLAQRSLDAISPLATLARGYAIVTGPEGVVLLDASRVNIGDEIEARLAEGRVRARVTGRASATDNPLPPDQTP
jgi:exodeoxyribonuclease VII large subunit